MNETDLDLFCNKTEGHWADLKCRCGSSISVSSQSRVHVLHNLQYGHDGAGTRMHSVHSTGHLRSRQRTRIHR
jgi:hypothetical protein